MSELVKRAEMVAYVAHGATGQVRKYTNEPYIGHPVAVAELVKSVPHSDSMVAAALLHDVIEDTALTSGQLCHFFPYSVVSLVEWLTDVSKPEDGNRKERKAIDRDHITQAPIAAKTIKLADLIDNMRSIVARDPDFAKVYMAEKRLLLEVLKEGDSTLWKKANQIVEDYYREQAA